MTEAPKPHVVFVDDEPLVLAALGNRLRRQRKVWDLSFCETGADALAKIAANPPAIVVADLGMPEMDGAELLTRVREVAPGAIRIALSGQVDSEAATRLLSIAHQYLAKPCDVDWIVRAVERRQQLASTVGSPEVIAIVAACPSLPAAPKTYAKLSALLAKPSWSVDEVARVVEADAMLTAKIVQIAASPFFGFRRPVTTVREAVRVLGASVVSRLVLGLESGQSFPPELRSMIDLEAHARHAQAAAAAAAELAPPELAMDAYVAGLVHDLGVLVLALARPDEVRALQARAEGDEERLVQLERETWGFTHADVGGALLSLWGLPCSIVDAVLKHHDEGELPELARFLVGVRDRHRAESPRSPALIELAS